MKIMQSFDGLDLTVFLALCVLAVVAWLLDRSGRRDLERLEDEARELWRDR